MHRNAEIWEKRHERLERLRFGVAAHFGMAPWTSRVLDVP